MSRVTWFVAGAATGVYGVFKARRTAWHFTPDGVAARLAALGAGFRLFTAEVSAGMAEREAELRHQLAVAQDVEPGAVPAMIEPGTTPAILDETEGAPDTVGHR